MMSIEIDVKSPQLGIARSSSTAAGSESHAEATQTEQLESVLNQGLAFLSSLSQMTTGKAMVEDAGEKAIEIDGETGGVVLRFKMPGF